MNRKQKKNLIRIIVSALLLALFCILKIDNKYLRLAAFCVPYLIIGYDVLKKAFKGIINRQVFDENFLMAIATVGALAIGFHSDESYAEAVAVMLFYQIGELFQSYAVGKSRRSIADLMDIRPDTAYLFADGEIKEVSPEEVETGSIIIVSAGEKIPIDGVIVEGTASLDTSALTGESVPKEVTVGDEVISGCINSNGVLKIRTTKLFGESTVSKILDLVENSSAKKAKSEQFISKFARYYTPAVCFSALALAVIPPVIRILSGSGGEWSTWFYRALTFLVISCPCALVISIPLTFFAGIGGASREGILVKGATYLEELSRAKYLVFDKTGTLTKGVFEVTKIVQKNAENADILRLAAYAEAYSNHPIGLSIKAAFNEEIDKSKVTDIHEYGGSGITVKLGENTVAAGNAKLMDDLGIEFERTDDTGTVVYVAENGIYLGYILISDMIKETSAQAIAELKNAGVRKTVMLTGDSESVADYTAKELNIDSVYSELLPEGKVKIVEDLLLEKGEKEVLAFCGDGINDAPVLSRADVGIAMGALGSDAAIEAADVVLMDDNPLKISKAISLSKKCIKIVYENITFAIGVKLICLLLGALGIANMWLAIFADVGVMVIAVLNAVRALKTK